MAIKVKIPHKKSPAKRRSDPIIKAAVAVFIISSVIVLGMFAYFWLRYERMIDRRMSGQIFENSARIYARPSLVSVGETISADEIAAQLRRSGYNEEDKGALSLIGNYRMINEGIEITPGAESYHSQDGARVVISGNRVVRILGTGDSAGKDLSGYELEPQLITALLSDQRAKRQIVKYPDIPKVMVNAVLAIEDRRFFQHSGVNYFRLLEAALVDLREGSHGQGGSTLTMQMARAFFLSPQKTIRRKAAEILIAIELEQKFSKEQIFELYANQVDMGQRGSFTIVGFAEAARAYFNKDLQSISLPEAALLAGIVQRPSYLSPYRHPDRAMARRNLVLDAMVETGAITSAQAEKAKAAPLNLAPMNVEASDAPYFVDMVRDQLGSRYGERELNEQAYRIYTTLDLDLQRAAAEAVVEGGKLIDEQVDRLRTRRVKVGTGKSAKYETKVVPGPQAQVALVALDPHTGDVLALVGGRNYAWSQLNHAVAKRPTGSIFKPFVYATAMNSAVVEDPEQPVETPVSLVDDSPTTFAYGEQIYEPRNYKDEYHGEVTARYALAQSLNNATVKLAETIGYDKVAALARAAGITSVKPTPAMALGAYDATPMEMAGAYTVFANQGVRLTPALFRSVRDPKGDVLEDFQAQSAQVLDPRVAYVMTNMMETVINSGTGYEVRRRGFTAPAAGKTGTSHDAWFAGYTSNLLCIVWVGYDDYSDLRLSGGVTAAPIWAEFMKRAVRIPEYRDASEFVQPSGVVNVQLDKTTNRLATPSCPDDYSAAFIAGTEPKETCEQQPGEHRNLLQRILGLGQPAVPSPPQPSQPVHVQPPLRGNPAVAQQQQPAPPKQAQQEPPKKKKGFWGKVVGAIKGDSDDKDQQ